METVSGETLDDMFDDLFTNRYRDIVAISSGNIVARVVLNCLGTLDREGSLLCSRTFRVWETEIFTRRQAVSFASL